MKHSGFKRSAGYLVRPDGNIAMAVEDCNPVTIDKFLRDNKIRTTE